MTYILVPNRSFVDPATAQSLYEPHADQIIKAMPQWQGPRIFSDQGPLASVVDLATSVAGVATVAFSTLTRSAGLAVTSAGTSTVAPALKESRTIAASTAGTSTVTASLRETRLFQLLATAASAVTAALSTGAGFVPPALSAALLRRRRALRIDRTTVPTRRRRRW